MNAISFAAARELRGGMFPHVPPPAAPVSSRVVLELEAPDDSQPEVVLTDPRRRLTWKVALERRAPGCWVTEILLPSEPTRLNYCFDLADGRRIRENRQKEGVIKPWFGVWQEENFHLSVYQPTGDPPEWVRGQVVYQIFPDRFYKAEGAGDAAADKTYRYKRRYLKWGRLPEHPPKGRDFFGGNLRGVIEKLDYLEDLGVSLLYFTPIFTSPTNHRYDTINYHQIDPLLGTEADLKELVQQVERRNMRILLDGVFNHCSSESIYFTTARQNKLSPYYRWFNFRAWPDKWVGWVEVQEMPEFLECPEVEAFFFGPDGVAQHWLERGSSGWRTDVTPWLTDEYWRRFRKGVQASHPDAYIVAEDWGDATHRLLGDMFDATMNYRFGYSVVGFANGKLTPAELDDRLETLRRDTPPGQFQAQMNLIGSHDTARVLTLLGGDAQRLLLAASLQLAYPGVPMVCYGDEAGVEGEYAEASRRTYPWGREDSKLLNFYRTAIRARRGSPALSLGDVETAWIGKGGSGVYGFLRRYGEEVVLALANNSDCAERVEIPLDSNARPGEWVDLLGGPSALMQDGVLRVELAPLSGGWYQGK